MSPRERSHPPAAARPGRPAPRRWWTAGLAPVLALAAVLGTASAGSASEQYNFPGQVRTRTCVRLRLAPGATTVRLRYADGQLTGYTARSTDTGRTNRCHRGQVEIDAGAAVPSPVGLLYFHPGGPGYTHQVRDGQYGFITIGDLRLDALSASPLPLTPSPGSNGQACAGVAAPVPLAVHAVPSSMHYKKLSLSAYANYGDVPNERAKTAGFNPRSQAYAYMAWSWVRDQRDQVVPGGGMVEAVVAAGTPFSACQDVAPIWTSSYGRGHAGWVRNGQVQATYGAIEPSPGVHLYGWVLTDARLTVAGTR